MRVNPRHVGPIKGSRSKGVCAPIQGSRSEGVRAEGVRAEVADPEVAEPRMWIQGRLSRHTQTSRQMSKQTQRQESERQVRAIEYLSGPALETEQLGSAEHDRQWIARTTERVSKPLPSATAKLNEGRNSR
jgi:hypothetical protein